MVYAQFYEPKRTSAWPKGGWIDHPGEYQEATGSDGVFILDGRNSPHTWSSDAVERARRLRGVKPQYVAFEIRQGRRFTDSRVVVSITPISNLEGN